MGLLDFLWKKPRLEAYYTNLPMTSLPELSKAINKKLKQRNAQLEAENLRLKSKVEDKGVEKIRKKEEEGIKKEILTHKSEESKNKKLKGLKIYFALKNLPTFSLRNKIPYGKLKGIFLREFSDGYVAYYPLLTDGNKEFIFKKPAYGFEDFFKDNINLVSQIKSGSVDTNFDVSENKQPLFIQPGRKRNKKTMEEVEVIHLDERERIKYENQIAELMEHINQISRKVEDSGKKEIDYEHVIADKEMAADTAMKDRDIYASSLATLAEKMPQQTKALTDAVVGVQDLKAEQVYTDRLSRKKDEVIRELDEKLIGRMSKEEGEIGAEKIKNITQGLTGDIKADLKASLPQQPPATPPAKK